MGKPLGKWSFRRFSWEHNIKVNFEEVVCDVDLTKTAQDKAQCQASILVVLNHNFIFRDLIIIL
jgi:hypothetical protein